MKKSILILFLVPVLFRCSEGTTANHEVRVNAILNKNSTSTTDPLTGEVNYKTSVKIEIPKQYAIDKVKINTLSVEMLNYNCPFPEREGRFDSEHSTKTGSALDVFSFTMNENFSTMITDKVFLAGLEQELKAQQNTQVDFSTWLPPDSDFEIELSIYLHVTVVFDNSNY